ncbi:E3 ubiquitin-protein ligase Topors-like [Anser cygnoides]|uniref:E3 ubiquitin-protein ligase Topors-like n=1 Tax=Anser cygnoides TaxID=8845 RepID=UPI0034D37796
MDCDCMALTAYTQAQRPTPLARARTPAERLREVWSEEQGWPWCWCRALGVAAAVLSALPRAIRASPAALLHLRRRETQEERSQQQRVTPAAAAPVRRSSPSSPAPPSPLPQLESMAMALDSRCPICLDTWDNASYVMPCLHQFCFRCIQQWVDNKPECPLCKRRVSSIVHSVRADDSFEELVIPPPAEALLIAQHAERVPGRPATRRLRRPAASRPQAAGPVPTAPVGGLHPYIWASLFRLHPEMLQLLLPWLCQELGRLLGADGREATAALNLVISSLCFLGLDQAALTLLIRTSLQSHARSFVQRLIDITVQRCSREAHRLLGLGSSRAAGEQEGNPAAAPGPAASPAGTPAHSPEPSSSPSGTNAEDLPGTSTAALQGGPGHPPSSPVPVPRNQEEPQEEPPEAAAGPSTAQQSRDRPQRGPRQAPKRRAPTSQASAPPAKKRPPRRQH